MPKSFAQDLTKGKAPASSTGIYRVKLDQLTFAAAVFVDSAGLFEQALTAPAIGRLSEVRAAFFNKVRLAT